METKELLVVIIAMILEAAFLTAYLEDYTAGLLIAVLFIPTVLVVYYLTVKICKIRC